MASRVPPAVTRMVSRGQVAARRAYAAIQLFKYNFDNQLYVSQSTGANHSAGEVPHSRRNDAHTAIGQDAQICLRGWVRPHLAVHSGGNDDWCGRREVERGQEVVSKPMGEAGQKIGRRRRDDEEFSRLRLGDVLNRRVEVGLCVLRAPQAGDDLVPGKRGEGERLHEARGRCCHHDVNVQRLGLKRAYQFRRLVGSDSAGDTDRDLHRVFLLFR